MLAVTLLNSAATLNYYNQVASSNYVVGAPTTIVFQLSDADTGIRYIPSTSATCTLSFKCNDGTMLSKSASMMFNPDDRSIWQVSLLESDTSKIVGNTFLIQLDVLGDGTQLMQVVANNALGPIFFDENYGD